MRRAALWLFLSVSLVGPPASADDALVLPRGALRVYLVPTWTTVDAVFGPTGERQTIPAGAGRSRSFNLGYAIEYGVTNCLTAGVQWTPGTILSSSFDFPAGDPQRRDQANLNDALDAKVGFKLQVVGSTTKDPRRGTGLYRSRRLRLALAVGVKTPLTRIDWEREKSRLMQGRGYLAQAADKHLVAPIGALYADWVLLRDDTRELFVNVYSEYIPYLSDAKYNETSLARYLAPSLAGVRVDYRYDFFVETEPRLEIWTVPQRLRLGFYLPVRYKVTPSTELDGFDQHNDGYRATIFPTLSVFSLAPGFPVELKLGYQYAFAGRTAAQTGTWMVMFRVIIMRRMKNPAATVAGRA